METQIKKYNLIPVDANGNLKYNSLEEFNKIIMSDPRESWVKTNKYSNNARYLPIRIVEELLIGLYTAFQVDMVGEPKILGNSSTISVQLKVYHPILKQWLSYAGVGAVPVELEKGAHPMDFSKINPKGLHKNLPATLSFATTNAAKKIGRIFGSHLNSTETIR